ncbi:MAG: MFS transporter, partial [Anaerolineae bacterium]|nr:MFS transporter [Anaerolineae bacterium]
WGHRKEMCVWSGGGVGRLMLLLMALSPLLFSGPAAVYVLIGLAVARVALSNLTVPAWVSLTADLVPLSVRGRYLSARNMAMGLIGMVMAYLMGQMIARLPGTSGYQWALGLAFAIGMLSTWSFARIDEPPVIMRGRSAAPASRLLAGLLADLRAHPAFLRLCAIDALWGFSLNVAGPFFGPYLVQTLGADTRMVGTLAVINVLAALPGQRLFGIWTDRWGPRRVMILTGLLIPLVPWGWGLAQTPWQAAPAEMASGFLWAGYGLASFNFLLLLIPEERRPRYTALYQIVVMVALSVGAAVGGIIATRWGYRATMVLSGAGRLIAALLFACFVRLPKTADSTVRNQGE